MAHWTAFFLGRTTSMPGKSRSAVRKARRRPLACESLEGRAMLTSGLNVDYTLMGGQWNNAQPISFSVAPDGVMWDQATNNVNAKLGAEFGSASWQREIATALQTWAASANLNFVPSSDGAYPFNTPGQAQGDARFGDIRVVGYAFPTTTIAQTYGPPPNGWTAAGDVKLNTSYNFGPDGQWDLRTTLLHEVGHSLGLGESPQPGSVMYGSYSGVRHDLSSYDVEGIQSIYGPRVNDAYQASGQATSAASAVNLASAFNSAGLASLTNLSLSSIGDAEYFAVTAPSTQGATLLVKAIATSQSLMSPKVTVIDPTTGATLATDAHPDQYGDTASVSIPGVQAGHKYLIIVTGATQDVFAVGNYSLQASFSGGVPITSAPAPSAPVVSTSPTTPITPATTAPTTTAPASPPSGPGAATTTPADRYAANNSFATVADLGTIAGQTVISGVTLPSGQDVRVFAFEPGSSGLAFVASANATIVIGDSTGKAVASGRGLVGFQVPHAGARYFIIVLSPNNSSVADAGFAIQVVPVAAAVTPKTPASTPVTIGHTTPHRTTASSGKATKAKRRHR